MARKARGSSNRDRRLVPRSSGMTLQSQASPPSTPTFCLSLSFFLPSSPSLLPSPLLSSPHLTFHRSGALFFPPQKRRSSRKAQSNPLTLKIRLERRKASLRTKADPEKKKKKKSKASKGTHGKSEETKHESYVFLFFSRPLYLFFLAPPTLSLSKLFGREKHVSRTWKMLNPTSTTPPSQVVKPCKHWCCDQVNTQGTHTCRKAHARQICRDLAGSFYSLIRSYKKKNSFFHGSHYVAYMLFSFNLQESKIKAPSFF